jgi:hypothetical protein
MEKVDSNNMAIGAALCASRDSLGIDVLTPSSTSSNQYEGAPVLSLFDNAVFRRGAQRGSSGQNYEAMYASTSSSSPWQSSSGSQTPSKLEILRRGLLAILPSQHDVDILCMESYGWWVIRRHILPQLDKYEDFSLDFPHSLMLHPDFLTMRSRNHLLYKECHRPTRL